MRIDPLASRLRFGLRDGRGPGNLGPSPCGVPLALSTRNRNLRRWSGIVITSQTGHRLPTLPAERHQALATTPANDLTALAFLQPGTTTNSALAYAIATRPHSPRKAASVQRGDHGARLNSLSPDHHDPVGPWTS